MKKSAEGKHLVEDGSNYDKNAYEKVFNTVDIAICQVIKGILKILLGKRKYPVFRDFSVLPGGFCDIAKKHSLEDTAYRELYEETNIKNINIRQLATYSAPDRDPRDRIITTVFYALVSNKVLEKHDIEGKDDLKKAKWFSIKKLPKMGFDHKKIIKDLRERLKEDILNKPIAFELVEKQFTWTQLQEVYEAVLGRKLVTPNFRRKINSMYKIKETKHKSEIEKGRPPTLLEFKGIKAKF